MISPQPVDLRQSDDRQGCDCDAVPAWIMAPVSAKRLVMTPENGAVMRV